MPPDDRRKQRVVILRAAPDDRRRAHDDGRFHASPGARAARRPDGAVPTVGEASVDIDELEDRKLRRLRSDPSVLAVAPAMPMRLITPHSRGVAGVAGGAGAAAVAAAAARVAWGVAAVGADTSDSTGAGIVVAVLDTGIDADHPAFAGVDLRTRRNFTTESDHDIDGHGTHCAGTIFGRDVDGLRIGVAPGVRRAVIGKVLGEGGGSSAQVAEAIMWAMHEGAHVISLSLGIDFPGFVRELQELDGLRTEPAVSLALEGYRANVQLFERLAGFVESRGQFAQPSILVAAAGNESGRRERPPFAIAASPPAVAPGILSVAALGPTAAGLDVAEFSNTGPTLAAPGVDIVSARAGATTTGQRLDTMSGTSMATPHVAGVAALWAEHLHDRRQFSVQTLVARLLGNATYDGLVPGIEPADVGRGLARAPQRV